MVVQAPSIKSVSDAKRVLMALILGHVFSSVWMRLDRYSADYRCPIHTLQQALSRLSVIYQTG